MYDTWCKRSKREEERIGTRLPYGRERERKSYLMRLCERERIWTEIPYMRRRTEGVTLWERERDGERIGRERNRSLPNPRWRRNHVMISGSQSVTIEGGCGWS